MAWWQDGSFPDLTLLLLYQVQWYIDLHNPKGIQGTFTVIVFSSPAHRHLNLHYLLALLLVHSSISHHWYIFDKMKGVFQTFVFYPRCLSLNFCHCSFCFYWSNWSAPIHHSWPRAIALILGKSCNPIFVDVVIYPYVRHLTKHTRSYCSHYPFPSTTPCTPALQGPRCPHTHSIIALSRTIIHHLPFLCQGWLQAPWHCPLICPHR